MNTTSNKKESTSELKRRNAAWRNGLVVAVLLLLALGMGSSITTEPGVSPTATAIWWVALTCGAFGLLLVSSFINYRQSDERQKLIQLKAAALAFMSAVMGLLVVEMLHAINALNVNIGLQATFIGSIILWNILVGVIERRSHA